MRGNYCNASDDAFEGTQVIQTISIKSIFCDVSNSTFELNLLYFIR